ncbi:triose-phosphate isomerase [Dehalobacterium formicoaceticum]|uniref:Triosephosphate isomerase n=1 Tax=Dehalobacterium formicoaceticum TaxID=51515 RepID=A0ABT1Y2R6_9FIRM|nr:triose-phosphate isomerase [Dehalobacterium formicoaceticum]MCR6545160.1 triose-phosphate isomerase [Dehalobacterium formicoaceticum]
MRKPIIAGNWKMFKTPDQAVSLVNELKELVHQDQVEAVVCPPFVDLPGVLQAAEKTGIKVGAQNMHWENEGAFTGEISPLMLTALGCEYVIIGHSERRQYFAETDETVNLKVKAALHHGLKPILCVGETLEQREAGIAETWVEGQVRKALADVLPQDGEQLILAYEPIWAIGTGKTATADDAGKMLTHIRGVLKELFGMEMAEQIRLQYGGSVKAENIKELMEKPDIDGALVGGASLKAETFSRILLF